MNGRVEEFDLAQLDVQALAQTDAQASKSGLAEWQGRRALRLVNGLALVPGRTGRDGRFEVFIGVERAAYPGIAFRVQDAANYELAYAVPHASGLWDALQYDPVFRSSNTWQLFYGPAYQRTAEVPVGQWFRLGITVKGHRAAISIDDQPPLVVEQLAHPGSAGRFGLWTFLPAWFSGLTFTPDVDEPFSAGQMPQPPAKAVDGWVLENHGFVPCEPNGVLCLSRHLPLDQRQAWLHRSLDLTTAETVTFELGFSDELVLAVDETVVFEGKNLFAGFADRAARGYAELGRHRVELHLPLGQHRLDARLKVHEGFGWGLVVALHRERDPSVGSDF